MVDLASTSHQGWLEGEALLESRGPPVRGPSREALDRKYREHVREPIRASDAA